MEALPARVRALLTRQQGTGRLGKGDWALLVPTRATDAQLEVAVTLAQTAARVRAGQSGR